MHTLCNRKYAEFLAIRCVHVLFCVKQKTKHLSLKKIQKNITDGFECLHKHHERGLNSFLVKFISTYYWNDFLFWILSSSILPKEWSAISVCRSVPYNLSLCLSVKHCFIVVLFLPLLSLSGGLPLYFSRPEGRPGMSDDLSEISGLSYIWFPFPISFHIFSVLSSCSFCVVIFLLMVHSLDFFPKSSKIVFVKG